MKNVLMATILFLVWTASAQPYSGGTGTAADPYQLGTADDLLGLSAASGDWDKHFVLTADIDLDGQTFLQAPIAPDISVGAGFQGTPFIGMFDGRGHTVFNLTITASTQDYVGLFGFVGVGGRIKNMGVVNVAIQGRGYVGGLAGKINLGELIACHADGSVNGTSSSAGGLVGENYGSTITFCHAVGPVVGATGVGGLVGANNGRLSACYADCSVVGTGQYSNAGGLVGYNEGNTTINCFAAGSVIGSIYVGGLVGTNGAALIHCYSVGSVGGDVAVAGLLGYNWGPLTACFWNIQTSGQGSGIGDGGSSDQVNGLTTAQMRIQATFLDAGWDFTNEALNGILDPWRMCADGVDFPRFNWETTDGDFACPGGVNAEDLDYHVSWWLMDNCTPANLYCGAADMNYSGAVDLADLSRFAANWMKQ